MTRQITSHHVNACNRSIAIEAGEVDPTCGNASHAYTLTLRRGARRTLLQFQHGPIGRVGVNGITNEALLAVLIDRLEGFQSGQYACEENADALVHLRAAVARLHDRTKERTARSVEGTHEV